MQNYGILGCLREQYEDLGAACKEEVFKRQAEAANDWRTDNELNEACQVLQLHMSFRVIREKGRAATDARHSSGLQLEAAQSLRSLQR